jgi:hypothetical protein
MTRYFFFNLIVLLLCTGFMPAAVAQDTTQQEATEQQESEDTSSGHSPLAATILSAVLPGAGQVYNKKYWKPPIIYAGFAGGGYAIHTFNGYIQEVDAAIDRKENNKIDPNSRYAHTSLSGLEDIKRTYTKWRDASIIVTALWYVLNIVDANVDAHLYEFDVSDDLSFRVAPQVPTAQHRAMGVRVSLNFTSSPAGNFPH